MPLRLEPPTRIKTLEQQRINHSQANVNVPVDLRMATLESENRELKSAVERDRKDARTESFQLKTQLQSQKTAFDQEMAALKSAFNDLKAQLISKALNDRLSAAESKHVVIPVPSSLSSTLPAPLLMASAASLAEANDLSKATASYEAIPNEDDRFDTINEKFKASIGRNDDYNKHRVEKKLPPIGFRLVAVEEIKNAILNGQFERAQSRLKEVGRTADELKIKWGFHGTRPSNLKKISATGLLRTGHPLNPSKSTDPGWFGSPQHGIYLGRHVDYSLKYSNDMAPLAPGETVKVILFKLVSGKSFHVQNVQKGMLPTSGYDSHSSANFLEWYLFSEDMCFPAYILTVRAFEDRRTDADDTTYKG